MNPGTSRYAAWAARWRVTLGFALGVAYLAVAQPTPTSLLGGGALAALGLALRAYAAGCLEKDREVATGGPYRYTRNPLYLGSAFIGLGFAYAGSRWLMVLVVAVFFALVYWPVLRREEAFLREKFPGVYQPYAERVPLLIPTGRRAAVASGEFRWERYRRNREYQAALGFAAGVAFLVCKMALR